MLPMDEDERLVEGTGGLILSATVDHKVRLIVMPVLLHGK